MHGWSVCAVFTKILVDIRSTVWLISVSDSVLTKFWLSDRLMTIKLLVVHIKWFTTVHEKSQSILVMRLIDSWTDWLIYWLICWLITENISTTISKSQNTWYCSPSQKSAVNMVNNNFWTLLERLLNADSEFHIDLHENNILFPYLRYWKVPSLPYFMAIFSFV